MMSLMMVTMIMITLPYLLINLRDYVTSSIDLYTYDVISNNDDDYDINDDDIPIKRRLDFITIDIGYEAVDIVM